MNYFFLSMFIFFTSVHLYASAKENNKLRAQTKIFILPFLLLWYISESASPDLMVILAISFSWIGDILLIGNGYRWFTAGGISFMLSHFFFIISYKYNIDFSLIPVAVIVALGLFYLILCTKLFKVLRRYIPKALFFAMFFYLLINSAQNCFAFYRLLTLKNIAGAVTFIGATQFFISDSYLFIVRFKKDGKKRNHFFVMLSYCLAEFLIVLGLLMNS